MSKTTDPAHGANKNYAGAKRKVGGNKGIARARKEQKRIEAEIRQRASKSASWGTSE